MKLWGKSATQCCNSISSSAQYVTLYKFFSNPSAVVYFFPTLRIKLINPATANSWEIINSKPPGPPIRNSEWQSDHIFNAPLWQVVAVPITSSFFFSAKFALGFMKRIP
jgi:hypothetical protein